MVPRLISSDVSIQHGVTTEIRKVYRDHRWDRGLRGEEQDSGSKKWEMEQWLGELQLMAREVSTEGEEVLREK